MTTTASEVYTDVVLLCKLNIFQSRTFLIKIYDILKKNILTCSCWASVESWLLWRNASRSSLLYSGFRCIIELPLQPYKIQLYTFRVQGLAFFLLWFPDYVSPIYINAIYINALVLCNGKFVNSTVIQSSPILKLYLPVHRHKLPSKWSSTFCLVKFGYFCVSLWDKNLYFNISSDDLK